MRWIADTHTNHRTLHRAAHALLAFIGIPLALSMIPLWAALEFAQRLVPFRRFDLADRMASALEVSARIAVALAVEQAWMPVVEPS